MIKKKFNYFIAIKANKKNKKFHIEIIENIIKVLEEQKLYVRSFPRAANTSNEVTWQLVYYEHGHDFESAKLRCHQLKQFPPSKMIALIERHNPGWRDLGVEWLRER